MTVDRTGAEIRAAMQQVTGPLPEDSRRVPLDIDTLEEHTEDGYTRRKITFACEPGDRCSAWLLLPDARRKAGAEPGPAMLCLHQTTAIGKDEPVGLGGKPNLHYGQELVQRGYTVLAPDYPNFGDYKVDAYGMGYASATIKAIWNHMRAMDLLGSQMEVDAGRIGAIGHSLGGHNALFLAVFEPRVRLVVSSGGFTRFTWNSNERRGERGDMTDWSHAGYMPRIASHYDCRAENLPFDMEDVLAAIAPRPLFINAPRDDFFEYEGVDECVEIVKPLYARNKAGDDLVVRHPDCGHDFPPDVRKEAYVWVDARLGARPHSTRS